MIMVGRHVKATKTAPQWVLSTTRTSASSAIIVRVTSALLQALILVVMARSTAIEQFGQFSTSLAIGAIAIGVFSFGLPTRVLTVGNTDQAHHGISASAVVVTVVSGICAGTLVTGTGWLFSGAFNYWTFAAGSYVMSEMVCNLAQNLLFGEGASRRAEVVILLRRLLPLVGVLIGALGNSDSVFLAAALSFVVSAFVVCFVVGSRRWNGWQISNLLKGSVHYWTASLWAMLQQLDVTVVSYFAGPAAAGGYAAGFRIASPVHIVTSSLISIMVPKLSRCSGPDERRQVARKYMRLGILYASLLMIASPLAGIAGPWLLGPQFTEYGAVFVLLIVNSSLSVLNQLQSARFYGEGEARSVATASGISTTAGLVLIVVGALYGGVVGAALGTIAIQALLGTILMLSWRKVKLNAE